MISGNFVEKYFFVESDKEIYVKFTGTDSGTMEYSIQKLKPVDEVVTTRDFITCTVISGNFVVLQCAIFP